MSDGQGKAPLDNATDLGTEARAERYATIARQQGETISQKELAMTKRPRDEAEQRRAEKFLEIDRRQE